MNPFSHLNVRRMLRRTTLAGLIRNFLVCVVLSATAYAYVHMDFSDLVSEEKAGISHSQGNFSKLIPMGITPSGAIGKLVFQDN